MAVFLVAMTTECSLGSSPHSSGWIYRPVNVSLSVFPNMGDGPLT